MPNRVENGRLIFEDDSLAASLKALTAQAPAQPQAPAKIPVTSLYDRDLNLIRLTVTDAGGTHDADPEHLRAHPEKFELAAVYVTL